MAQNIENLIADFHSVDLLYDDCTDEDFLYTIQLESTTSLIKATEQIRSAKDYRSIKETCRGWFNHYIDVNEHLGTAALVSTANDTLEDDGTTYFLVKHGAKGSKDLYEWGCAERAEIEAHCPSKIL